VCAPWPASLDAIPRADVAAFLVGVATSAAHVGEAISLTARR
jgi:hypothetical protein